MSLSPKMIATAAAVAGLGALSAVALAAGGGPEATETTGKTAAAPLVRTEVVRRTVHVTEPARSVTVTTPRPAAVAVARAAAPAPAAVAASASAPAQAPTPTVRQSSDDDRYDDHGGDRDDDRYDDSHDRFDDDRYDDHGGDRDDDHEDEGDDD